MQAQIEEERKPALEQLALAEQSLLQVKAEVEQLKQQIQEKETEIDQLSQLTVETDAGLGQIEVPDPEASSRAYALRVEVAGLYNSLSSAKATLADATQSVVDLQSQSTAVPIDADPRMAELYTQMEAKNDSTTY